MKAEFPPKLQFLFEQHRYKVAHGGRGGAKSWGFARALLILGTMKPLRVLCARETMESIQQSVHQLLSDQVENLGLNQFYTVEKARIWSQTGTLFTFAGLAHNIHNIKSLESYDIVWVEEAHNVSHNSWEKLIPTIRKDDSEIWVSFNPELPTDDTYKRFVLKPPSNAVVVKIGWQDNPWFPEVLRTEMEDLKARSLEEYNHVYGGECSQTVKGAIYSRELQAARTEKRIGLVPYNRTRPVHTVWDLGHGDLTAIWYFQAYEGQYHFIDYLEGSGLTIADYLVECQAKKYVYGTFWLPFDGVDTIIHKRLAGDRSRSIEMIIREAGYTVRIVPKVYITDRLNAARSLFPQCRFDEEKCADGLQALSHFQWGEVNEHGVTKREPLHNWASHAAEAFTRAGQVAQMPKEDKPERKPIPHYPVAPAGAYAPFS
jgi:phage terminase large subunit